jgi:hypothetical protein
MVGHRAHHAPVAAAMLAENGDQFLRLPGEVFGCRDALRI